MKFTFLKRKFLIVTTLIISILIVFISWNINWGGDKTKWIILADGKGYYAYLPAIFIYHDLNYGFFEEMEMKRCTDPKIFYDYRAYHNGNTTNKYFCGTALLQIPFFLTAHLIAQLKGFPADGYSPIYAILIQIAGICYLAIGLFFLGKLLQLYHIKKNTIIIVLTAAVFGTNLFYYTIREVAMSHVYSFALISMFLYTVKYFSIKKQNRYLIFSALLFGLIMLVRPVNGIIIFAIPFVIGSKSVFLDTLKYTLKNPKYIFINFFFIFMILSFQPLIYKISTGSFFIDTYNEESFNFMNPAFFNFLFSYKKGAFLYTPLLFISLAGFIFLRKNPFRLISGIIS
ncbi:MAG: hypothetical protein PHR81_09605 [Bacteroidales bacterium]|jgi:hypothetical protein|nr:hypothetical protein [Bacteroidales bacterium]MDD4215054.1 hypothetical protein [Bacteroidales bacterium]